MFGGEAILNVDLGDPKVTVQGLSNSALFLVRESKKSVVKYL
jgi:hypothetical protein